MQNKILSFLRRNDLLSPGDHVICALSGGADSVALAFCLYLMKDKLDITLSAAHFNHHLRGDESDRDEQFVRSFCHRYDIPLAVGHGNIVPGKKGLEAAARDARYAFLKSLPGKIATAHTADDNAETVLMHLVRGTGLKGLGGIAPRNGNVIRPMLTVTRQDVEEFCDEWCLSYITDSSNEGDEFLRNRLRHHVMPLLKQENPTFSESVSSMALGLRLDEEFLASQAELNVMEVETLCRMHPAQRSRALERFLKDSGLREPERSHIAQTENLVFSPKPSSFARFPGGVTIARNYGVLELRQAREELPAMDLPIPGSAVWGPWRITTQETPIPEALLVRPAGTMTVRPRMTGDTIRLPGGTKSLKKLFIDRKIPASQRSRIPVLCDEKGILAVHQIGVDTDRANTEKMPVWIHIEEITNFTEDV